MSVFVKRKKIEEYIKIIMEYVEVITMKARTKYCLLISTSVFSRGLCGEKGENKNSGAINRPKIGIFLRLN